MAALSLNPFLIKLVSMAFCVEQWGNVEFSFTAPWDYFEEYLTIFKGENTFTDINFMHFPYNCVSQAQILIMCKAVGRKRDGVSLKKKKHNRLKKSLEHFQNIFKYNLLPQLQV